MPLSPNYDRLSQQGWAFDNLYATGTRSVRGIEAVLTGFTPSPAQAVVKMPKSQQQFFTLAELLNRQWLRRDVLLRRRKPLRQYARFLSRQRLHPHHRPGQLQEAGVYRLDGPYPTRIFFQGRRRIPWTACERKTVLRTGVQFQQSRSVRIPRRTHRAVRTARSRPATTRRDQPTTPLVRSSGRP